MGQRPLWEYLVYDRAMLTAMDARDAAQGAATSATTAVFAVERHVRCAHCHKDVLSTATNMTEQGMLCDACYALIGG